MLTVEIDDAEMTGDGRAAKVLQAVSVKGFRKGKVPRRPDRQYRRHFGSAH